MGTVLDLDDSPVNATVTAYHLQASNGEVSSTIECTTSVDIEGRFECPHLHSGTYVIMAEVMGRNKEKSLPIHSSARSYESSFFVLYPAPAAADFSSLLYIPPGGTTWADLRADRDSSSILSVKSAIALADTDLHVSLKIDDVAVPLNIEGHRTSGGEFDVGGLFPGHYSIEETAAKGERLYRAEASISVTRASSIGVTLNMLHTHEVSGAVHYNGAHFNRPPEVILNSLERGSGVRYVASVFADGSFVFHDIPDGLYTVSTKMTDGFAMIGVAIEGRPADNTRIKINQDISELDIFMRPALGSLSGTMSFDSGASHPGVLIQNLDLGTETVVGVSEDGRFAVNNLPPGRYRLLGFSQIEKMPYNTDLFLRRFADKAIEIDLERESHLSDIEIECVNTTF